MTACLIYRSGKKEETYLYLPIGTKLDDLPEPFQQAFGEAVFVMKLDIDNNTKLARVDPAQVLSGIDEQGYFLQLPPKHPVEEEITRRIRQVEPRNT